MLDCLGGCAVGFFSPDALLAFSLGLGIGAYKDKELGPCLRDTLHLSKQKSAPALQNLKENSMKASQKAKEASMPYVAQMQEKLGKTAPKA